MEAAMGLNFERFVSAGKGNGLRALRDIRAGEVLHSCQPFAFCIARDYLKNTCQNCFKRSPSLQRCSRCKAARYCSAACQKASWRLHRSECVRLERLHPRVPSDSVRLAARIAFRLACDGATPTDQLGQSDGAGEELYSIAEHQSHLEDMSEEKKEGLGLLSTALRVYLGEDDDGGPALLSSGLDPLGLIARVTCNCFSISDGELQDVGVGLYPSMSLLNHDCRPNCVTLFEGKRLTLRAVRFITAHEELSISYTDVLAPSAERQAQLRQQYHFLCQCQRCSTHQQDVEMLAGETRAWTTIRDALPQLERLRSQQLWQDLLRESRGLELRSAALVPDGNIYLLRLLELLMDACVSVDHYEEALRYGLRTLEPYRLYFSDPHPCRALQLLRVGKLQHYLGRLQDAERIFTQACDVMKVTHGPQHVLTSEVQRKLVECRAELAGV